MAGDYSEEPEIVLTRLKEDILSIRSDLRNKNLNQTKEDIRNSVTPDQHIIQAVGAIESLDKGINTLVRKLRDWYALTNPKMEHDTPDHKAFVYEVLSGKPGKEDMGGASSEDDQKIMKAHTETVQQMYFQRDNLVQYLESELKKVAPNVQTVAGTMIGSKLLSMAGSLKRLGSMPAGTIQMLGAETALFRHLKNPNARPPKHGIIFNHQLLQQAPRMKRGKVARTLADSIAIAARIDRFNGAFMGDKLLEKVEKVAK